MWKDIFPETIGSRNSLDYLLDNVIYRPRDILQLFIEIQKVFIPGKRLTVDKIQTALAKYSDEYFVEAMRDELTGFFPDDAVTLLPSVLSKMGSRYFYLAEFEAECNYYREFEGVSARAVLERLFNMGYIGQHRPRENMDYTSLEEVIGDAKFGKQKRVDPNGELVRAAKAVGVCFGDE